MKVLRDKAEKTLNVDRRRARSRGRGHRTAEGPEAEEDTSSGFGLTLGNLTPDRARRLGVPQDTTGAVVTDVDPSGSAARSGLRPGDLILKVNRVASTARPRPTASCRTCGRAAPRSS